jgi:hypothetical protein
MAYTMLICTLWSASSSLLRYVWYLSIPVLLFGMEALQLTGILQGTFCWDDMLLNALGIAAGWMTVHVLTRNT